jgi:2',3'-cyclic-nucleotide 2'-phosphodiesterase (5'-nucleotidase family)
LGALSLGLALAVAPSRAADPRPPQTFDILYVSNIPDIEDTERGGLAQAASILAQHRATDTPILFLHGGDSLAPSSLSAFDYGSHMIDLLNGVEPTVMAVAKREFSYREDQLTLRAHEAAFPFVCANILDPLTNDNLDGVEHSHMVEVGPYRIGLTAVVSPEVLVDYLPERIQVLDPVESLRVEASSLRAKGADLVIAMADFREDAMAELLGANGVDILISSDSQTTPIQEPSSTPWIRMGEVGLAAVSHLTLEDTPDGLRWTIETTPQALANLPPDPDLRAQIDDYKTRLDAILDTVVGTTSTPMDTRRDTVRTQESAFGNLITDAMRATLNTDLALFNGGGIRGDRTYEAGSEIHRRDIQGEMPFRNTALAVEVTGAQVLAALENGFSRIEDMKGRFPQVSGMVVHFNSHAPSGQRVVSVTVRGDPLDPKALYSLATVDFLAKGGDGYDTLAQAKRLKSPMNVLIWQMVHNYVSDLGTISPKIEGRIVDDAK